MIQLSLTEARQLSVSILRHHGFSEAFVQAITDTLIAAQSDACSSHGLYRLLGICDTLKAGKVVADAEPEIIDQAPGIVRADARGGFSQLAFQQGLPLLREKAAASGIAALAINHCVHFSALWIEVELLAEAGLVALACNPTQAYVAPAGGKRPLLGTNPFAFAWPRPGQHPFVFDFATSAIARGDVELHRREGKSIPQEWGVDADGNPCTDPAKVLDEGAMLPFGGHKGSALATMIELIAGPLIGDLTSPESLAFDGGSHVLPHHGELIIALDPARFLGQDLQQNIDRAEALFDAILGQGARLPSQRRFQAREKTRKEGLVEISANLYADLKKLLD